MVFKKKFLILFLLFLVIPVMKSVNSSENKWYKVIRIIDGDTLVIWYQNKQEKVRLFGIDAPEKYRQGYFKAAAVLEELCFRKKIRLIFPYKNKRGKFGRLLAKVYLSDGRLVNQLLLEAGVVKLYKKDPLRINKRNHD